MNVCKINLHFITQLKVKTSIGCTTKMDKMKKFLSSFLPQACVDLQIEIRQIAKLVNVKNLKRQVVRTLLYQISINLFSFQDSNPL